MREVVEIDWVSKRATLEFYISSLDTDHEHLVGRVMLSCEEASMKVGKNVDVFLLNTDGGSRSLITMIVEKGQAKGFKIDAIGF